MYTSVYILVFSCFMGLIDKRGELIDNVAPIIDKIVKLIDKIVKLIDNPHNPLPKSRKILYIERDSI